MTSELIWRVSSPLQGRCVSSVTGTANASTTGSEWTSAKRKCLRKSRIISLLARNLLMACGAATPRASTETLSGTPHRLPSHTKRTYTTAYSAKLAGWTCASITFQTWFAQYTDLPRTNFATGTEFFQLSYHYLNHLKSFFV